MQVRVVYWLLAVSLAIAVLASYASFCFIERVASSRSRRHVAWLTVGAFVMGLGIWSMHYLGMLAIVLPVEVLYHVPTVLVSLLLSVFAAAVALVVVSRPNVGARQITLGSVLMGVAIGSMHYAGMWAMRSSAMHTYDPGLVLLSIVVAVSFSWCALWIAFSLKKYQPDREGWRLGGAFLMGTGILSMHCVAQGAVTYTASAMPFSTANTIHISTLGIGVAGLTTIVILLGALWTALIDRQVCEQVSRNVEELVQIREKLLRSEQALRETNDRLIELSIRDGLTGMYNRRHFDAALEAELRRSARALGPLTLLMIDVDHFKLYNDLHGHPAGDICLRAVADCLQASLRRSTDLVARYGGEEFAVILPDTDFNGALLVAERMRNAVQQLYTIAETAVLQMPVTISVGICSKTALETPSAAGMLASADEGLYRAKANGRNCVRRAATEVEVAYFERDSSCEGVKMPALPVPPAAACEAVLSQVGLASLGGLSPSPFLFSPSGEPQIRVWPKISPPLEVQT